MEAIAAEAEVTKPVVYRAVGDKQAVAAAVAEHLAVRINDQMRAAWVEHEVAEDRIEPAIRAYLEVLVEDRQLFLFVQHGWGSKDNRTLEEWIERSADPLMKLFRQLGSPESYTEVAARTWAYSVIGMLRIAGIMWVRENFCDIDELVAQLTEQVRRSGPYPDVAGR
jgi:AcrR family transcriptional regulator